MSAAVEWRLDANAGLWLSEDDLDAVTDWIRENRLRRVRRRGASFTGESAS